MELRTGLEQRLFALRAEASAGRRRLAELQAEQHRLLGVLARIDTAVRILADELAEAPGDGAVQRSAARGRPEPAPGRTAAAAGSEGRHW